MILQAMQLEMEGAPESDTDDLIITPLGTEDLRELINEQDLIRLVEEAVSRVNGYLDGTDHARSWEILLGVLTYFYAVGVYCSEEIEATLENYAKAQLVDQIAFHTDEPAAALRGFRRDNRAAIEHCLCHLIQKAYPRAIEIEIELEAVNRVVKAIEADTWALDA